MELMWHQWLEMSSTTLLFKVTTCHHGEGNLLHIGSLYDTKAFTHMSFGRKLFWNPYLTNQHHSPNYNYWGSSSVACWRNHVFLFPFFKSSLLFSVSSILLLFSLLSVWRAKNISVTAFAGTPLASLHSRKEGRRFKRFHSGTQFQTIAVSGAPSRCCHVKGKPNRNKSVLFDTKTRTV